MRLCGDVAVQLCSYVAIWLCVFVATRLCGYLYVAMWQCGYVSKLQNVKLQNFSVLWLDIVCVVRREATKFINENTARELHKTYKLITLRCML